ARARRVDLRVLAATDADLERATAAGRFREPLLHRLAGYEIRVPPLRSRMDDLGRLIIHFLRGHLASTGEHERLKLTSARATPWLSSSVVSALALYSWPGNVRELQNVIRQIVISSRGADHAIVDAHLREQLRSRPTSGANSNAVERRSDAKPDAPQP